MNSYNLELELKDHLSKGLRFSGRPHFSWPKISDCLWVNLSDSQFSGPIRQHLFDYLWWRLCK